MNTNNERVENYGTKEIEDVLDFALSIVDAAREAKKNDGKIDVNDSGLLLAPMTKLIPAVTGAGEIPLELDDLSQPEVDALTAKYGDRIHDSRYRRIVHHSTSLAIAVRDVIDSE